MRRAPPSGFEGMQVIPGDSPTRSAGAAWAPFLLAFAVATVTAFSYLELVTGYPQAAGAALYTHNAFGVHLLTFLVAFAVLSSGITSASTASNAVASFLNEGSGFMALIAAVNFRGAGESVKANVVATSVELSGLLLVIGVGFWAMSQGRADFTEVTVFESAEGKSTFLAVTAATALAFFAMVGFEDSVNMAEAGYLLGLGVVLWVVTMIWNRAVRGGLGGFRDPNGRAARRGDAPHN